MTYDLERWGEVFSLDEWRIEPDPEGPYVLAADAEAHEKAAVQQAIRDCIAAVREEFAVSNEPPYVEEVVDALRALLDKP